MQTRWIGLALSLAAPLAAAQTTIYKHVDESGRVTYTNRPMKGAMVVQLEPLSTIPGLPRTTLAPPPSAQATPAPQAQPPVLEKVSAEAAPPERSAQKPVAAPMVAPAVAVVTPRPAPVKVAAVQRTPPRDETAERRRSLEGDLARAEKALAESRKSLAQEQRNPALVAAVRTAQQAVDPSPAEQAEMRLAIERASGRIRGLQSIVAEHEKTIEALKNELGALKP